MATGTLTIHLDALRANWRALDAMTGCETSAVVKANGYGIGVAEVATALAEEGARTFFVAVAEEGVALRRVLGPGPVINVFSGHMPGDAAMLAEAQLVPMINSIEQMIAHAEALPGHAYGIQLDTGMNRLGMEPVEWGALRQTEMPIEPVLIMSHLACADEPEHSMNKHQLRAFREMTAGIDAPRSFANTGAILMGSDYHFDLTRPGIGTYGGLPFEAAQPVVQLDIPVIQCRTVLQGETVGYGNSYTAPSDRRVATISAGYADGIIRLMGPQTYLHAGEVACPIAGRISMDLIGVDVTDVGDDPESLALLGPHQGVDRLAENASTIGYEILTSLGHRYARRYVGG